MKVRCNECGGEFEFDGKEGDIVACPSCGLKLLAKIVTPYRVYFETVEDEEEGEETDLDDIAEF
ncbi:MAG: hypothetical protein QXP42_05495 [Candidatus Micrarchaeia archaeon]